MHFVSHMQDSYLRVKNYSEELPEVKHVQYMQKKKKVSRKRQEEVRDVEMNRQGADHRWSGRRAHPRYLRNWLKNSSILLSPCEGLIKVLPRCKLLVLQHL